MTPSVMPGLTERAFQQAVVDLARRQQWKTCHFNDSRRQLANGRLIGDSDAAGWPDLVLVKGAVMVIAELKRDGGKCSPAQEAWLVALANVEEAAAGSLHVTVWRPSDWSTIVEVLGTWGRE